MRISDWSSDVCSSDLPHPKRWLGTVQATYAGDKSSKAISRPACLYTAAPAETMWGVRLIKWPESGRPRCAGYGRREVRRAGQHYVDPTCWRKGFGPRPSAPASRATQAWVRSEEHTSELQSLMRTSYAVFCLKQKKDQKAES